ncbi:MAG: ribose-phosphate pyrophosphokinase, partial [Fimbriimonadales bacterium]
DRLREKGVRRFWIACTHGLFSHGALDRLGSQDGVEQIVATNTIPAPNSGHPKLVTLSIGRLIAEAIQRIHTGRSVSELFGGPL